MKIQSNGSSVEDPSNGIFGRRSRGLDLQNTDISSLIQSTEY
jgi:hypothetical protein